MLSINLFLLSKPDSKVAGKAPASVASKAPVSKTADKKVGGKKTSKPAADGDKKKRRKVRKETYASYIYKGELAVFSVVEARHLRL